jgi:hypothetical protein
MQGHLFLRYGSSCLRSARRKESRILNFFKTIILLSGLSSSVRRDGLPRTSQNVSGKVCPINPEAYSCVFPSPPGKGSTRDNLLYSFSGLQIQQDRIDFCPKSIFPSEMLYLRRPVGSKSYQLPRSPKMSITWPNRSAPFAQFCWRPVSTLSASPISTPLIMFSCPSTEA